MSGYVGSRHSEILADVRAASRSRELARASYVATIQAARDAGIPLSAIAQAAGRSRQSIHALTVHPTARARYRKGIES